LQVQVVYAVLFLEKMLNHTVCSNINTEVNIYYADGFNWRHGSWSVESL